MKNVNILLERKDQDQVQGKVSKIIENYDAFVFVEASEKEIQELEKEGFKVIIQDDVDRIQIGTSTVNTDTPRYNENGTILEHPSYKHTEDPGVGLHHYIVQFIAPIKEEWIKKIEDLGGIIGAPYPAYSYIVELDGNTRNKVINLPYVNWVGHYDPSYRITSETIGKPGVEPVEGSNNGELPEFRKEVPKISGTYYVSFHSRDNMEDAINIIKNLGATVNTVPEVRKTITVTFSDNETKLPNKLKQLSTIHGVRSIEPFHIKKISNNIATSIIINNSVSKLDIPLKGTGEIIAVADTGLDTGDPSNIHKDFAGRIKGIKSWPIDPSVNNEITNPGADDGPSDVDSGHGTHVTGSVLGNGTMSATMSDGPIRGLAYEAQLFFQALEQMIKWKNPQYETQYGKYLLLGIPSDLTTLFKQAYDMGARIHTNSWGGGKAGSYDETSKAVDKFIWDNKDMTIIYAAGNDGIDKNGDGKIDIASITPPATSKNCIAVGASENMRQNFNLRYGTGWPSDFPKAPISLDKVADNPADIAAFSSRGPTGDGRFKPDVVAPGTYILSTKSSLSKEEGWSKFDDHYFFDGGTSMATPLTAGAVAIIRQYIRNNLKINPSAALVKAALIHTANRETYRYAITSSGALWDPEQGWGHVNLKPFIQPDKNWQMKFLDVSKGLKTGQSGNYDFQVKDSSSPVKITLVWNDAPAGDYYPTLINNLDLIVTGPDGKSYHGNVFTAPYDKTTDKINNVEVIFIQKPKPGKYKIMILASEVKKGQQDFAMIYSGNIA